MMHQRARCVAYARFVRCWTAAILLTSCRKPGDLVETPRPASSTLELRLESTHGDTSVVALQLLSATGTSVGSLTASVAAPTGWKFLACNGSQGSPLLACKSSSDGADKTAAIDTRIAGVWVAGTHGGAILTLSFVRESKTALPTFALAVSEIHSAVGRSLVDSVTVRRDLVP